MADLAHIDWQSVIGGSGVDSREKAAAGDRGGNRTPCISTLAKVVFQNPKIVGMKFDNFQEEIQKSQKEICTGRGMNQTHRS